MRRAILLLSLVLLAGCDDSDPRPVTPPGGMECVRGKDAMSAGGTRYFRCDEYRPVERGRS